MVVPKGVKTRFKSMIVCSTIEVDAEKLLSFMLLTGLFGAVLVAELFIYFNLLGEMQDIVKGLLGFVVGFVVVEALGYMFISMSVNSKTKKVEEALPDALQLMSSNIRAGLTTDKALILAARPEFGPLAGEIKRVGRETMMGRELAAALMDITKRIKSDHLTRTMELIVSSIQSGGELADLLDQTAGDLRDQQLIQKEISAGVLMYVIFIFIAIGVGAPALFAVSGFLVKMLVSNINIISAQMPAELSAQATISITTVGVTSEFINMYSLIALVVSSLFGGIIMGLIRTGKVMDGITYIPILLFVSLGIYFIGNYAMNAIFGGMMGV
ncbi:MAG: type II secretion system F family protein [Candidatus Altiarchaeota archaeon]|nr:type II secretion system F family protein [Candidatus Altiarchaeota archaeon]